MADGQFPSLVSKDRDVNALANPIYIQLSDGTVAIGVTGGALDVNVDNATIAVTQSGVWDIGTVTTLTGITNDVNISDGGNTITVDGTVAVSSLPADVDIRDIVYTQDSIEIWANTAKDGTGTSYVPLVDADGKLIISNPAGGQADDSAFTPGTSLVSPAGFFADETAPDSVDEGDTGAARMTLDRKQLIVLADATTDSQRLNITAAGEAEIDIAAQSLTAVKISKDANANTELNPIYTYQVNTVLSGNEIHDFDTAAAVASDASDTHTYTVAGTTFLLKSIILAGSGNIKAEIKVGPTASTVTKAVIFLNDRQGDTKQVNFDPAIEVPATGTGIVQVIRTNRQGAATDLYSTIIGSDVA